MLKLDLLCKYMRDKNEVFKSDFDDMLCFHVYPLHALLKIASFKGYENQEQKFQCLC